jgi:hypothetical protein
MPSLAMPTFSVLESRDDGSKCCLARSNFCHLTMLGRAATSAPAVMESGRASPDEGRATSVAGGGWCCTLAPTKEPEATGGERALLSAAATSAVVEGGMAAVDAAPRGAEGAGPKLGAAPSVGI